MFGRKKNINQKVQYDKEKKQPVLHISICTGEQVAGFRDKETGKFEDVMLITSDKDLKKFLKEYGIPNEDLKKEW